MESSEQGLLRALGNTQDVSMRRHISLHEINQCVIKFADYTGAMRDSVPEKVVTNFLGEAFEILRKYLRPTDVEFQGLSIKITTAVLIQILRHPDLGAIYADALSELTTNEEHDVLEILDAPPTPSINVRRLRAQAVVLAEKVLELDDEL
jgi:hypothetical protein